MASTHTDVFLRQLLRLRKLFPAVGILAVIVGLVSLQSFRGYFVASDAAESFFETAFLNPVCGALWLSLICHIFSVVHFSLKFRSDSHPHSSPVV